MAYAGKNPSRTTDSALSTLPLLLYLAMGTGLMVADHRHGYGQVVRQKTAMVTDPFWWLASAPLRIFRSAKEALAFRSQLQDDNERKRHDLQIATARIHRLNAVAEENLRLRQLLGTSQSSSITNPRT